VKGTRLWQAPGSPIIQGRSRTERPFWERWLGGVVGAELIVLVVALLLSLRAPGVSITSALTTVAVSYVVPALPGCAIGAALGVWVSRTMGWRRHWLVGSITGATLAALTIAFI
jgi:hypothetical protein